MKQETVNKHVELLAANMALKANYARFAGSSKRMIIVEGNTDRKFVQNILLEDVWCMTSEDVFTNDFYRRTDSEQVKKSNKQIIVDVVYGLDVYPTLITTKGLEEWRVYGMIDRDFDDSRLHQKSKKLFITDTHDLETLLLSTDEKLLGKIDKCTISAEDIRVAFFISYQLGVIKNAIIDVCGSYLSVGPLSAGNKDINYGEFISDRNVSVPALMNYLNSNIKHRLPAPKLGLYMKKVLSHNSIKKRVDKSGLWKQSPEDFDPSSAEDFWNVVNGHDILAILRLINEDAETAYSNAGGKLLNRDFEVDLIENYDYDCIKSTKIYADMKSEAIV